MGFFNIVIYIKDYEHKESKTEAEYINKFNLSTKYIGVSNTSNVLVRPKLLYVDHKGWFVDEIEYLQGGIILDCLRRSDCLMADNQFGFNNGALPIQ